MTPPDKRVADVEYDSSDVTYVEFSDVDHPWEPVPPEEIQKMLQQINRRNPNAPPEPDGSKT